MTEGGAAPSASTTVGTDQGTPEQLSLIKKDLERLGELLGHEILVLHECRAGDEPAKFPLLLLRLYLDKPNNDFWRNSSQKEQLKGPLPRGRLEECLSFIILKPTWRRVEILSNSRESSGCKHKERPVSLATGRISHHQGGQQLDRLPQ